VCDHAQIVLVHDAARPLVTAAMIDSTLEQARLGQGGIVARPVHETVKVVGDNGIIVNTSDRRLLWIAETPQAFPFDLLWRAHEHVLSEGLAVTDDAQAVEALGLPVAVCPAVTANPKITVPSDLTLAEAALAARAEVPAT
jgi:2-C-methyl-D-erythritol 4-phosphate cytidylyltransferase